MRTEDPQKIFLRDYKPPAYLVDSIALDFDLHPTGTKVRSVMRIRANPAVDEPADLVLDGEDLRLAGIVLDGAALAPDRYTLSPGRLSLHAPPRQFELEIHTEIDPTGNTRLEGLYQSGGLYCTQCEAQGFRRITYYLDRPDVLSVFTVRISAPKDSCPVLLSNGNELESADLPNGRHTSVWHDPHPKPAYLFALAAGDLAVIEDRHLTTSGRIVRLRIFVDPGNEAKVAYAMDALKRSMKWDEEVFGLEYDLDDFMIVAVRAFNMGAMENKGLNIFNSALLIASPETATDEDYARIEAVIAHEYFHNWTGNRVTCRDWFQLSLKEGLTVFRDQLFSADMRDAAVRRIEDVKALRARQFPEDDGPLAHPPRPDSFIEIDNFYTATVYEKGAEICRMLHTVLGRDRFRTGLDLYFKRHDGHAVRVEDFVAALGDANGLDLMPYLAWYTTAGRPTLKLTSNYDAKAATLEIELSREGDDVGTQPLRPIPVSLGALDGEGRDIPLPASGDGPGSAAAETLLILNGARRVFRFKNVSTPPIAISPLRGLSAPVSLRMARSLEDDIFLFGHDTDAFNRWDAGQRAATHLIHKAADDASLGAASADALAAAMGKTLQSQDLGDAFKALALCLPELGTLAQTYGEGDPQRCPDYERLFAARSSLEAELANHLQDQLLWQYKTLETRALGGPEAGPAGARALRLLCLSYLAKSSDGPRLVSAHYADARSMTDLYGALQIAVHMNAASAPALLADFYERFNRDPLVIDKWFRVQSTAPLPGSLDRIRSLQSHPAYDGANPNRIRSVVGGYIFANLYRFHTESPDGYAFLADEVLRLDRLNPQLAARMLSALENWRRLKPVQREAAKAAIARVAETPEISANVFEIARKSLNA